MPTVHMPAAPSFFRIIVKEYRFSSYYLRKYSFIKDITDKYYEDPVSFPVTVSAFFGEGVMPWHHSFAKNLKAGSIRIYIRKKTDNP